MSNLVAPPSALQTEAERVFPGRSEVAAQMRAADWSKSPLGPIAGWPQSLRTAVSVMIGSPQPAFIFWGPEYAMLYNDSGLPILGAKHPEGIGQSIKSELKEAWPILGPLVESVVSTGTAVFRENLLIPLKRFGFIQDGYYTFSYVPILNESAAIGGIFVAVIETTAQVVGARRLALIRELSLRSALCQTVTSVLQATAEVLGQAAADVPFTLLYELHGERAQLVFSTGIERGHAAAPSELDAADLRGWPLAEVARCRQELLVEDLAARFGALPGGPSGEPATRALLLPLRAEGASAANLVLVVGLNPRIVLDDDARSFLNLLARQLATSIASTRALEEKTQRAAQLAELDRQKTQFFSNVSHEFRTPLTLILGPTEDALASSARVLQGADLDRVHGNAQRLLKLVNTLLEFSRIEAGKAQALFQPTDLATLTAGLANAFDSVLSAAGLRFLVDCPPLPESVWVDRDLWEKIVLNLVSNAFKFTLAGQITVRLRWTGQGVELAVEDTGIGIAAEELPRIFQRFHRVEGAQGRSYEGSGIGLSLVKELVKLHGGQVSVHSTPGVGTTFTVSLLAGCAHLPAAELQPHEPPARPVRETPTFVREAAQWLPTWAGQAVAESTAGSPAGSLRTAVPRQHVRVLLADDNVDMRGYVQSVLSDHFTVEAVADGGAALAAARARLPDVVLSDVMMPVLDGIALTRALREDPKTRDVPIILLSARAGESATVQGLQAGADDYIIKPFGARELVARIEGAVKVARAEFGRRKALERVSEVLESASDGFFALDAHWRFVVVNASYERMTHSRREDLIGGLFWDICPGTRDPATLYWQEYNRCMSERVAVQFLDYYAPLAIWTDVRANPTPEGGIAVSFRDVSLEVQAKEVLVRQAQFEKQLIGIVSHDLRNPLSAILMGATLLQEYEQLTESGLKIVTRMQSSTERATRLVNDLLDFTQARLGGGIRIERSLSDVHEVVRGVLDELRTAYPSRELTLRTAGSGLGEWDADRLAQVVHNLVTNALKYSPKDTTVQLQVTGMEGGVDIAVHNLGAPIPGGLVEHLFQPMQRGPDQQFSASRSVGLGLYIVKQIVDAHGGTVTVSSNVDHGTSFTVSLPRLALGLVTT